MCRSTVKVERCRYLEASKCKGTCMNLCKLPTEAFFKEDLGTKRLPFQDAFVYPAVVHIKPPPIETRRSAEGCLREVPSVLLLWSLRRLPR